MQHDMPWDPNLVSSVIYLLVKCMRLQILLGPQREEESIQYCSPISVFHTEVEPLSESDARRCRQL